MVEEPEDAKKMRLAVMKRAEDCKVQVSELFEVHLGRVRMDEDDLKKLGIKAKPLRMQMSGDRIKIQFDSELTEAEIGKIETFMQSSPHKWKVVAAGKGKLGEVHPKDFRYLRNPDFEKVKVCAGCGTHLKVEDTVCAKCQGTKLVEGWKKTTV